MSLAEKHLKIFANRDLFNKTLVVVFLLRAIVEPFAFANKPYFYAKHSKQLVLWPFFTILYLQKLQEKSLVSDAK